MGERAREVGGELRITSRPGAGTELECRLPYDGATRLA
jgi:signal transduction histidine kinase